MSTARNAQERQQNVNQLNNQASQIQRAMNQLENQDFSPASQEHIDEALESLDNAHQELITAIGKEAG